MHRTCHQGATFVLMAAAGILTGCHVCERDCEVTKICRPEAKIEKVVQKGWDVECEQICIPPIRCPFSNRCERPCAKVIAVHKLKADQLECGERGVIEYQLKDAVCPTCGPCDNENEPATLDTELQREVPPAPAPGTAHVEP